jgi:hypothetical protein
MSNSRCCSEKADPVTAFAYDCGGGMSIVLREEVKLLVVLLLIVFIFLF